MTLCLSYNYNYDNDDSADGNEESKRSQVVLLAMCNETVMKIKYSIENQNRSDFQHIYFFCSSFRSLYHDVG